MVESRRATALVFVFMIALLGAVQWAEVERVHGGDWTGPFLVGGARGLDASVWPIPVRMLKDSVGYDGQFYLALALDPFLRTPLTRWLDDPEYRAHRITGSLAAWLLGAGSDARRVFALYALGLLAITATSALAARAAQACGRSAWWGIALGLGLGPLVCLWRMLGDALLVALLAGLVAWTRGPRAARIGTPAVLLGLAMLQKETAVLAAPVLLLDGPAGRSRRALAGAVAAAAVAAAWWVYVDLAVPGPDPFSLGITFGAPFLGMLRAVHSAVVGAADPLRALKALALLSVPLAAVGCGWAIGFGEVGKLRAGLPPNGLRLGIALFAVLSTLLTVQVWGEPWSYARVIYPLLALEFFAAFDPETPASASAVDRAVPWLVAASALCGVAFTLHHLIAKIP
jgi:hypothetical protein